MNAILDFWFGEIKDTTDYLQERNRLWFEKNDGTDRLIRERFGSDVESAARGDYDQWTKTPQGLLALVLLLDQFSRNIYRGTPQSFAQDSKALELARRAVAAGQDRSLHPIQRGFLYLPFEHAEDLDCQELAIQKFQEAAEDAEPSIRAQMDGFTDYAVRHRDIIARFGRFPHRNQILSRTSTPAELEFLKQPGSSF